MPREIQRGEEAQNDGTMEDEPIPPASDEVVLEETARMAREGRKEREADPREPKPAAE